MPLANDLPDDLAHAPHGHGRSVMFHKKHVDAAIAYTAILRLTEIILVEASRARRKHVAPGFIRPCNDAKGISNRLHADWHMFLITAS